MHVATHSVPVAEFMKLPNPRNGYRQELRAGEVVEMPPPLPKRKPIQKTIMQLLDRAAPKGSYADQEMAFRALTEHEVREADVAWISTERMARWI